MIFFLILSSANVDFLDWKLRWRIYTTQEAFPTIRCVKLIGKKEFIAIVLNPKHETFVVYVMSLSSAISLSSISLNADIHPSRKPQIDGLIAKKGPTKVFAEYADFVDIFSLNLIS